MLPTLNILTLVTLVPSKQQLVTTRSTQTEVRALLSLVVDIVFIDCLLLYLKIMELFSHFQEK